MCEYGEIGVVVEDLIARITHHLGIHFETQLLMKVVVQKTVFDNGCYIAIYGVVYHIAAKINVAWYVRGYVIRQAFLQIGVLGVVNQILFEFSVDDLVLVVDLR